MKPVATITAMASAADCELLPFDAVPVSSTGEVAAQQVDCDEVMEWSSDFLRAHDLYDRLGVQPRGLTQQTLDRVCHHILIQFELDASQRKLVADTKAVLQDKKQRQQYDELYLKSYGVKPRGRRCWLCNADGTVVPLALEGDHTESRAPAKGKVNRKRQSHYDSFREAKAAQDQHDDESVPHKKRIRMSYQHKLDWLLQWDGFEYELPDGTVLHGNRAEEQLIFASGGQLLPTYLVRWFKDCMKERWPEWSPKELQATAMRSDIARAHGLDVPKKGRKLKHPEEWAGELSKELDKHIKGPGPPSTGAIAKSWIHLKQRKNEEIVAKSRDVMKANVDYLQQFSEGTLSLTEAAEQAQEVPQQYHGNAGASWVTEFKKKQGMPTTKLPRVSRRELADDDAALVAKREEIDKLMVDEFVPEGLVANADQVWLTRGRLNHKNVLGVNHEARLARSVADPALSIAQGPLSDGHLTFYAVAQAEHDTWQAPRRATEELAKKDLDQFLRMKEQKAKYEDFDRASKTLGTKKRRRTSKFSQAEPVRVELPNNARAPRTAITFGWMDGTPGRLQLQYGEGDISQQDIEWANTEYGDRLRVRCLEKRSHMCDAECIIEWLDTEVRADFRQRRKDLDLSHDTKGMLILDAGPHHMAWKKGEQLRRDELCKELNIILVFLDPGSSAHGQPMDQLHNLLRHYAYKYERLTLGFYDNVYLRKDPQEIPRTEAGNVVGLTNRQSIMGDLWALDKLPKHMWLAAWRLTGYLSEQRANDIALEKWGVDLSEQKVLWRHLKKQFDAIAEDQVNLDVPPAGGRPDNTPFESEVQGVYQLGELGTDQGWRTLHAGLQFAFKREFARRRYETLSHERLKIGPVELKKRAVKSLVFLGEREVLEARVQQLEKNPKVKPMLTYVTVHMDDMVMTPSLSSIPLPLRIVKRRLLEPLHQNEPVDLPESDELSWTLAAHYGLEHERPVPRYGKMPRAPAADADAEVAEDVGDAAPGVLEADGADDGEGVVEPDCVLDVVEANELRNLRALQKRRRDARSVALRAADMKRKEDAGWILTASGMWMFPGIVNKSYREGGEVPPKPSEVAPPSVSVVAPAPACPPPAPVGPLPAVPVLAGPPLADAAVPCDPGPPEAPGDHVVTVPIKAKWLIKVLKKEKVVEYRRVGYYRPRFLKPNRPATMVRLTVGQGPQAAFATYRVTKCEVVKVAEIPAGVAPATGTPEHFELFGGEAEVLAIHLGDRVSMSDRLLERYIGESSVEASVGPAAPLAWLARAHNEAAARDLLASGGWHLWAACLASAVGSRVAISTGPMILGSAEVVRSVKIGVWKPRAGGYNWVRAGDRSDVDRASFQSLQVAVDVIGAVPELHAVQVSKPKLYSDCRLSFGGAHLAGFSELKPADVQLLLAHEDGRILGSDSLFELKSADHHECMQVVLRSGFVPVQAWYHYCRAAKAASLDGQAVFHMVATVARGLPALWGVEVLTMEFKGNQNCEFDSLGRLLNTPPGGPHTHFGRASCVAISLAFAHHVFDVQSRVLDLAAGVFDDPDPESAGLKVLHMLLDDVLSGMAKAKSISKGASLHNTFVVDVYLVDPVSGDRGDEEALECLVAGDPSMLKNYYTTPRRTLHYLKAMEADGWSSLVCDTLNHRELVPGGVSLSDALALIDSTPAADFPTVFILVGSGKAFSIVLFRSCVLSFDSHQRSANGEFVEETCVGQCAVAASALLPSLLPSYGQEGVQFDVYSYWHGVLPV